VFALAPKSVLFVCHGNINRSPYAEALLKRRAESRLRIASAGFIGPGRSAPAIAIEVARDRGVSLDSHRSQLITAEALRDHDLVVVMDERQARAIRTFGCPPERVLVLGDLDPLRPATRRIQDPVDRPREDYVTIFGRIERCVSALETCIR
jgi:protein-tyrosine-phosphatase